MPDVLSLELGGGSTCLWNNSTVSEAFPRPTSSLGSLYPIAIVHVHVRVHNYQLLLQPPQAQSM